MPVLRPCSPALAIALQGGIPLWSADIFRLDLADGASTMYWTSWNKDLTVDGQVYTSQKPWINRGKWNVTNTMAVPTLSLRLMALGDGFNGGDSLITQIHNGLLDGANFLLSRAYMPHPNETTTLGTVDLFGGEVAGLDLLETVANINVKGKSNKLDQYAPRNIVQIGCNHAFCDVGCTLLRASFTTGYTVGASPTEVSIPWSVAPASPERYVGGSYFQSTGPASGQWRNIEAADATGLTLSYPLYQLPEAGDTFTAFEGCDKTFDSGSGRSCTDRANTQNYRGFEFVPPPTTAV